MEKQEEKEVLQALKNSQLSEELISQVALDMDTTAALSTILERTTGDFTIEELVSVTAGIAMEYHNADSVIFITIDNDLTAAECLFETHRADFSPLCGTGPMYMDEYPALLKVLMRALLMAVEAKGFISAQNILPMLPSGSREYKRMKQIGLESIMGVKYGKSEHQFIAVINPRKYGKEGDILRLLARVVDSEIDRLGQPNMGEGFSFGAGKLAKNEVYVKLLNAFELHTRKGVLTEEDITRNQEIVFLTVLLMKQDEGMIPATTLLHMLWEDPEALSEPERTLKNLSYRVNKKLKQLFPRGDFLEIKKKSYMVSQKYKITTDLDRFSYMIRDAEGVTNPKARLDRYLKALDDFSGIVLPQQDHQAIQFVTEKYESARRRAQNECLSLMFELGDYTRMAEYIRSISVTRTMDGELAYWSAMMYTGVGQHQQARELLEENEMYLSETQINDIKFRILAKT